MRKFWSSRKRSRGSLLNPLSDHVADFGVPGPASEAWDRGPAKYFHGRTVILGQFAERSHQAARQNAGTIFLVQGAPGAGKTALLAECAKRAQGIGWLVVKIHPQTLWDPHLLRKSLDGRRKPAVTGASAKLGVATAAATADLPPVTMLDLLTDSNDRLLLVLDEAQRLGQAAAPVGEAVATASMVLTSIHNGEIGRPVILLAGGLGTSQHAFEKLGISRFEGDCLVNLGGLDPEAERAVLYDWLTKDGGAQGDPGPWIDAITKETYGWPQHILSYVKPALVQLHEDTGQMTTSGLDVVLSQGRARRAAYYKGRTDAFDTPELQHMAEALIQVTTADGVSKKHILASLTRHYGPDEATRLFDQALHKGVLSRHGKGYAAPIPSMHNWLVSEYLN